MKGKVYIIGAGCGNIELLTLKGKRCIEEADCIIYDRLIDEKILKLAKPEAEFVYLGKMNTEGGLIQDEINRTIVEKALEGKIVARVKGGDPFVFGRGGEEIEEVVKNSIPFQIIPGISSSIAVPEYAGIPVTHRGVSKSFHVFTGHTAEGEEWHDFPTISKLKGTLIFLMGIKNLERITKDLIRNGKTPETPVAIIEKGTTPFQRVTEGTLENIVEISEKKGILPPAIIVVGDVVKFRDEFMWREKQIFFGKRIMVTRDSAQSDQMTEIFSREGAFVKELPLIKIIPNQNRLDREFLKNYSCILFNSPNGVRNFMEKIDDLRVLGDKKIGVVGKKTDEILREYRIIPDFMPLEYRIDRLAEESCKFTELGDKLLLVTSDISPCNCEEWEKKYSREFHKYEAYSTQKFIAKKDILIEALEKVDYITLMSSSTVESLYESLEGDISYLKEKKLVSIGPVTSETMRKLGMEVALEAREYDVQGIVEV
ncbi:MAG: uroporphyrinogen-III C-methyltransferase, partial [Fusobacteriaceae bacterium]